MQQECDVESQKRTGGKEEREVFQRVNPTGRSDGTEIQGARDEERQRLDQTEGWSRDPDEEAPAETQWTKYQSSYRNDTRTKLPVRDIDASSHRL